MAVVQADIKAAFDVLDAQALSAPMSVSEYNDGRATIIRNAILSADVATVVTGTLPNGPTAATGSGELT